MTAQAEVVATHFANAALEIDPENPHAGNRDVEYIKCRLTNCEVSVCLQWNAVWCISVEG